MDSNEITSDNLHQRLGHSDDVMFRTFHTGKRRNIPVTVCFIDGLVNTKILDDDLLLPLSMENQDSAQALIQSAKAGSIYHAVVKEPLTLDECIKDILVGGAALIFDDECRALSFNIRGNEKRGVETPDSESVMKGSKDSFVETMRVNTSMVRAHLMSSKLGIRQVPLGRERAAHASILYITDKVRQGLVEEVIQKLEAIDHPYITAPSMVEEQLVGRRQLLFPQVIFTQRPDRVCQAIVDGKAAILVDGLPFAYIVPTTLSMFMEAAEDYSMHYLFSSLIRILRYVAFFLSITIPALYIAVTTFHHEIIPRVLAVSIINSKQGVPFPTFVEVLMLLFAFELLVETGIQMPRAVGQAISIVGALIIGEVAVSASFISPSTIVIVALSGISGFIIPNIDMTNALRFWRIALALAASLAGMLGAVFALMLLGFRLASKESFGVPYLYPLVSSQGQALSKDTLIRKPFVKRKEERSDQ